MCAQFETIFHSNREKYFKPTKTKAVTSRSFTIKTDKHQSVASNATNKAQVEADCSKIENQM
jgi:hypothetical protein